MDIAPFKNQTIQRITGKSREERKFSGLISVTGVTHFVLKSVYITIARDATRTFSFWEPCSVGDAELRHNSFPQPIPQTVPGLCPCPTMPGPLESPWLSRCTGNRDRTPLPHSRAALTSCRVSLSGLFFHGLQWPTEGFVWSDVGIYYGIVIWTPCDGREQDTGEQGQIYLNLKLGSESESDELRPKSSDFAPLSIVGAGVDYLVGRCLPPNHLLRNINGWYILNVLGQGIFSLTVLRVTLQFCLSIILNS